jgi:D-2-hydroxyacid dehydrogenase (NADP+)
MTDRPELRKIVFSHLPKQGLLEAVQSSVPGATVVVAKGDELRSAIPGAQLVIGGRIHDDALQDAAELHWQHVPFAGVESVITPALIELGILLTNSRGVSAPNMAEHLIAMMLAFARALPFFVRAKQERRWKPFDPGPAFFELTGQTVLLLGTGAIGKATAERLRPFGCTIIGARRTPQALDGFDRVVGFGELGDVLPGVDHVVSSLPMTPGTAKLFSSEMIGRMKRGSHFFNVGRGGTVDQDALTEALVNGHLAGAGLDVTDPEPLPDDSPLWRLPNVLITSHTSGGSPRAEERVAELAVENIRRYCAGEDLLNLVDLEHGY